MVLIVWSSDPYASLLIEMIRRLIIRNDKMVLVRTLEIYTSLLEQTIVEENPLVDNVKQSQLAEFLADKVSFSYKSNCIIHMFNEKKPRQNCNYEFRYPTYQIESFHS